jgi:2-isopropylmalate synthase
MVPGTDKSMYDYVKRLKTKLSTMGLNPEIAVHCHNDRGLALANALDGLRAGATIIDTSVMGLGERAGIIDLATLLAVLTTDFDYTGKWKLEKLPELYELVSRYSNIPIPVNFPVTGANAFTHCAGVHTQAAIRNPVHYQSLSPELLGKEPVISLDHMSGIAAVKYSMELIGYSDLETPLLREILKQVKEVGQRGRIVDNYELKIIIKHILSAEPNRR